MMKIDRWPRYFTLCPSLFTLAAAGCSQAPERKFRVVSDREQAEQLDHDNPVGRFTAVPSGGGGIYVLDTRKGTVRYCIEATSDETTKNWEAVGVGCSTPSEVSGKQIAPNIRKLE
jgi:hypothetical protein